MTWLEKHLHVGIAAAVRAGIAATVHAGVVAAMRAGGAAAVRVGVAAVRVGVAAAESTLTVTIAVNTGNDQLSDMELCFILLTLDPVYSSG